MEPREPNPEEREAQIQRIVRQVEEQLRQSLPKSRQPLEQIEQQVVEIGRHIREIIETEVLAPLDQDAADPHTRCACGQPARYVAHYPRQLVTLNGERRLERAYYHCAACQQGFCPLDQLWEIGPRQSSVGVRALAARFASYLPPRKAAEELALVTGISLSASTVAVEATAVGNALQRQWAAAEERLWAGRAPAPQERPAQLQVSMDGVLIRVGNDWKEAKLGAVYRRRPGGGMERARYYASQVDSGAFGRRLRTLAQQEGVDYCPAVAVIGDGADWVWQETAKHFPRSVEILDYYHALEHLWAVGRGCLADEAACEAWIATVQERLLKDEVRAVIREIAHWEPATAAAREVQRKTVNYLRTHEHRMQYGSFRAQGYSIGSGVVESGCKTVVQARLKGAGMRWSRGGAEAMLHLRAAWCGSGPTDFLAAAKQATVYS